MYAWYTRVCLHPVSLARRVVWREHLPGMRRGDDGDGRELILGIIGSLCFLVSRGFPIALLTGKSRLQSLGWRWRELILGIIGSLCFLVSRGFPIALLTGKSRLQSLGRESGISAAQA